jgi:2,3-bisphosphoglycerate-dependent phosphoglycerate mutase
LSAGPTRYWFVRHGESVANAEGWLAGHRDVPLTERGLAQATVLRTTLAGVRPDRVVTSDLKRAVDTAAIAWNHRLPPAKRATAVRERHLGAWEGRPLVELVGGDEMNVLLSWDQGPPDGESHAILARRALGFLVDIDDGQSTLIFGHGGWIRSVVGLVDGVSTDQIGTFKVGNTEVVVRDVPVGTWATLLAGIS